MNPRYFIGISLPDNLNAEIKSMQTQVLPGQDIMEPLIPHITLLHPNILMTLSPTYFVPKVKKVASDHLPFVIELNQIAMFDSRVLYIDVTSSELIKLQAKLVSLLPTDIQARYQVGRVFKPHVTLAQAKPLQSLSQELIDRTTKQLKPLLPIKFQVSSLTQFTSRLARKYQIEQI